MRKLKCFQTHKAKFYPRRVGNALPTPKKFVVSIAINHIHRVGNQLPTLPG